MNSLNEDESGAPCAACAERLLENLPGVFHSPWGTSSAAEAAAEPEASEVEHLESEEA